MNKPWPLVFEAAQIAGCFTEADRNRAASLTLADSHFSAPRYRKAVAEFVAAVYRNDFGIAERAFRRICRIAGRAADRAALELGA